MTAYLSAHRATIVALVGVVLTYLSAKYGNNAGTAQDIIQFAVPVAAVFGVHLSPAPPAVIPSAQADHANQTLTIDTKAGQ